jgi:hypothetical protein
MDDERPKWCGDVTCQPLCVRNNKAGGQCIGKLLVPINHDGYPNTMQWCRYAKVGDETYKDSFYINQSDIEGCICLFAQTLRVQGLAVSKSTVNSLPMK